ncbi:universal stress protein [Variovorax sp. J22R133]|uniref:universal stress protein n=1 Tax=Variovorax brevis TaxID=3053503 RepID=UPI002574D1A4|nr:universal stress protein [Variovorax sp. J22R133]MDM0116358.1 universal stress protein [Variovorax sp. J22R133]
MYQRILVPIDGSETALKGLDEALKVAKLTGASVRLIHIVDQLSYVTGFETFVTYDKDLLPALERAGEQILQEGRVRAESTGVKTETLLFTSLADPVCDLVVSQARSWKADLIVIGTHGRRGVSRAMMGSDAEQIVRISPVPVLLVRAAQAQGNPAAEAVAQAGHAAD